MIERFIQGFRGLQRREKRFTRISGLHRDIPTLYGEITNEYHELGEAIKEGVPWKIRCEMSDIIINLGEMANVLGSDLKRDIQRKTRRNMDKYPAKKLRRLQDDWGFTPLEAMAFAKSRWQRERDKQYFT